MNSLLVKNADVLVTMDAERRECADFFTLELNTIGFAGALNDPVAAVVFCAPQGARHTVINGRMVVEDGVVSTVDMMPVVEAHNRYSRQMAEGL